MPSEFDADSSAAALGALEESCQRALLGLRMADARIERLLGTAFENQVMAMSRLRRCLRNFGLEATTKIIRDEAVLGRSHYLGFTRGSLFARGDRERAKEALHELPEAIRERETLSRELGDLINVRRTMLEQAAARAPTEPEQNLDRDNGRGSGRRRIR